MGRECLAQNVSIEQVIQATAAWLCGRFTLISSARKKLG